MLCKGLNCANLNIVKFSRTPILIVLYGCFQNWPQIFLSLNPYPFAMWLCSFVYPDMESVPPLPHEPELALWHALPSWMNERDIMSGLSLINHNVKPGMSLLEGDRAISSPESFARGCQPTQISQLMPQRYGSRLGIKSLIYLFCIHVFSWFSCFWSHCACAFRSMWSFVSVPFWSLQQEHSCFWVSVLPAEVVSQLAYLQLVTCSLLFCFKNVVAVMSSSALFVLVFNAFIFPCCKVSWCLERACR